MNIQFDRHIGDVIVYLQLKYDSVRRSFPTLIGYNQMIRIKVIEKKDKI